MDVRINPQLGENDAIIRPQSNARPLARHGCSRLEGFDIVEAGSEDIARMLRTRQRQGFIFLFPDPVQVVSGHDEHVRWVSSEETQYGRPHWHIVENNGKLVE
jgi:hypothetical protein